ncbi:MAG: bifunctional riboflavin kinase/FAD synthetase [Chlamydiia bacterium]|nr:bifunctional riboflavin kinase/FAD synthetase [Chlamydiia bacterium]
MKIHQSLQSALRKHCVLTIGAFDGLHLGHQSIFRRLKECADKTSTAVITFSNHPKTLFNPDQPVYRLVSLEQKIALFAQLGVDDLYLVPFTRELSEQSPKAFLSNLMQQLPFSHLILGHDAHVGYARSGGPAQLKPLANKLNFHLEYLPLLCHDDKTISSSAIRTALRLGDLATVEAYLGRPYSVVGPVLKGAGRGKHLGFPTANLDPSDWCLPPIGVYETEVILGNQRYPSLTNIGHAPTVATQRQLVLETHIPNHSHDLYGQNLNIIFKSFLRPEKKFPSIEALQAQIREDIQHLD